MKKGFTLIELLAVIAILAIIMIIATPRIMDAIENSRIKAYIQDEQMLVKATETYFGNNVDLLPENVGDTIEVTLDDLKTNEFIGEVSDSSGSCNGYILVTKTEDGYDYNPSLKCGSANAIGSSADDGLIAYYPFDDFQEPTENLLPDPVNDIYFKEEGSWYEYYDTIATITQNIEVPEWNTKKATKIKLTGGTHTLRYLTQGIHNAPDGVDFALQVKVKNIGSNNLVFYAQYLERILIAPGESKQIEMTFKGNGGANLQMRFESQTVGEELEFIAFQPQIEQKNHVTPFTENVRSGIVKDYSINNNNAVLTLSQTPTWHDERGGVYEFEDSADVISALGALDGAYEAQQYSWGAWIKVNQTYVTGRVLMSQSNILELTFHGLGVGGTTVDISGYNNFYGNTDMEEDKWYHVFITCDGITSRLYVNGVLQTEKITAGFLDPSDNIYIGNWSADQPFPGYIDEVRVYKRSLAAEEVKMLYNLSK